MNNILLNKALHVSSEQALERSRWFGPNLLTIIAYASETDGAFSLVKNVIRKGFTPPLHVHTREDEGNFVLSGEIIYTVGDETIHAKAGDYVYLPKNVPHTFKLVSDTAETLLVITPGGFEDMFVQCSRPASAVELPPVGEPLTKEFFEKTKHVSEALGATILPSF
jgi:quercetin dioxygenase-like cupin family protein